MVCAALAKEAGFQVRALTLNYGQRHKCELLSARKIVTELAIDRHVELELDLRKFGGSALTEEIDVPKGGVSASNEIPVTYVPARNLVFLSLTTAFAEAQGSSDIFIGVNALDYSGYPDCRPEFIASFADTAKLGTKQGVSGKPFTIHAPLQYLTKADIANECIRLGLDPAWSWSCYDPTPEGFACGACDSCRLRRKGFDEAGLVDTTSYANDAPALTE